MGKAVFGLFFLVGIGARAWLQYDRYCELRYCSLQRRVSLTRKFWETTRVHNEIKKATVEFLYEDGQTSAHPKEILA